MTDESTAADGETTTGQFVVTHADADSAVLKAVDGGQVHTLATNPGVEMDDVVEATLAPEPPMEVTWRVLEVASRRALSIEHSPEPPTELAYDIAADQPVGEVTRRERAGEGELHVLTLDPGTVETAAEEVAADEATRTVAARVGARRVELRLDDDEGVLSVRYLP
ncbi:DUF5812 family protein [Haloglomus litoreum]|uniref:DUF5812 family protein n=1 Tax=Haloglomus litoreum TaxID=3034026 RepID=UPI0023E84AAC|nr:DUF5812 family protein [Haloglomus sp. DT116]